MQVLVTARTCNLPKFLPLAYYWLACQTPKTAVPKMELPSFGYDDILRLLLIKEVVRAKWSKVVGSLADLAAAPCPARDAANKRKSNMETCEVTTMAKLAKLLEDGDGDPLTYILRKASLEQHAMCTLCSAKHRSLIEGVAQKILEEIVVLL